MRTTVFGATGGIGQAIVSELAGRGHEVVAASRAVDPAETPDGARATPTDLRDPAQARRAAAGSDVVVMAAQVPYSAWATQLRGLVDAAVDAAEHAGARLVMVDNLYAYGSPGAVITESTPESPHSRKGTIRRELGEHLRAVHRQGRVAVTIGRFSDYYGPAGPNSLVYQVMLAPAMSGRTARTYIAADQPHTFSYLPDAARGFATLAEREDSGGQTWILPAAPPVTQSELLDLVERALGHPVKRGHVSPLMLRLIGITNRELREAAELTDQWDRPYVTSGAAFEAAFGALEPTSHDEGIADTVEWFVQRRPAA